MKKGRKSTWLIVLILIAVGLYIWLRGSEDTETSVFRENPSLLFDRLWVDSVQKQETDFVHAFVVVTKLPIGLFQKASQYRIEAERFDYQHKKGAPRLAVHFPQTGKEAVVRYRVRPCNDLPPHDLCLEFDGENPWGGPRRYYGLLEPKRASEPHQQLRRTLLDRLFRYER